MRKDKNQTLEENMAVQDLKWIGLLQNLQLYKYDKLNNYVCVNGNQ